MLTVETLKNININVFEDFFRNHGVKNRTVRIKADNTINKYQKILAIINEEIKEGSSFTDSDVDELLFERLYYVNNNLHYLYQHNSFFANNTTPIDQASEYLHRFPSLQAKSITNSALSHDDEINICTVRVEENDSKKAKALHMLLRMARIELKLGVTNIFVSVTVDIDTGFLLIKFNHNQFEEIEEEPLKIVNNIIKFLNGEGKDNPATPLNFNIISLNEQAPKNAIYFMFEEMSKEAEDMLDSKVTAEQEQKIRKFLKDEIGLTTITQDYVEQIKAVIFQDISSSITASAFKNGWVFRFHYREGDHTRATSKQEDRGPVYGSKTFWQLKELIYREEEMLEAGFHWYLTDNTDIENFVDVRLTAQNDTMIIYHYFNTRQYRKEKEEFVLRKIAGHLS